MDKKHNYQIRAEVLDVFEENCTLAMFCKVKKPEGVKEVPPSHVHKDQIPDLLKEVGLAYLAHDGKKQREFLESPEIEAKGDFISFADLKKWVEKYVLKYTDEGKIKEALSFFERSDESG